MVKWEKTEQVSCNFFGHERHGLTGNAMSATWGTWLVEGLWQTPCLCGECHTLQTLFFGFLFKVSGAPWVLRHGACHEGRHQCIFYTSSPFLIIFAMFSLVPTPT